MLFHLSARNVLLPAYITLPSHAKTTERDIRGVPQRFIDRTPSTTQSFIGLGDSRQIGITRRTRLGPIGLFTAHTHFFPVELKH